MVHVINGYICLHIFIIVLCVPFGTWYSDDICGDKSVNYVEQNLLAAANTSVGALPSWESPCLFAWEHYIVALKGKYLRAQKLKTLINTYYITILIRVFQYWIWIWIWICEIPTTHSN